MLFFILLLVPVILLAAFFVARINFHVRDYPYNPALPTPGYSVDYRYDDPLADLYIRWCNLLDHIQTQLWKAPDGIEKESLSVPARDGYTIGGYMLAPKGREAEKLPTILYCHGGAFYLSLMPTQLDIAAILSENLQCRVVVPQYRLSLDAPYPTPVYDCFDTLQWLTNFDRTDPQRVVVYGDSAGGCLATSVAQLCRDTGILPLVGQMLIYPVTDTAQHYPSLTTYENATWTREANARMWRVYLRGKAPDANDYAVPMLHGDLTDLPQTYVEAAEMDTLCDQAIAYAEKLQNAGVAVTLRTIPGAYHGFEGNGQNAYVREILNVRIAWLRDAFEGEE